MATYIKLVADTLVAPSCDLRRPLATSGRVQSLSCGQTETQVATDRRVFALCSKSESFDCGTE